MYVSDFAVVKLLIQKILLIMSFQWSKPADLYCFAYVVLSFILIVLELFVSLSL